VWLKGGSVAKSSWPLEGYFSFGTSGLTVKLDCLGTTFKSQTESHALAITLPRLDSPKSQAPLARPPWKFRFADRPQHSEVVADAEWGQVGSGTQRGESSPSYAVVRQCIVESHIEAGDEDEFRNRVSAMSRELDDWFEAITDWLAALTDHNFVQLGSKQLSVSELGFNAWSGDESGRRHTMCGLNLTKVPRRSEAVKADQLRTCMFLARKSRKPPDEWLLIRDARSLAFEGQYRRAVLDAGSAAELALTAMLATHIYPSGDAIREALFDPYRTLGDLKKLALKLIREKVPEGLDEDLIAPRNVAVHKADEPVTRQTAETAILKAIEVVSTAHPIPEVLGV
jgi:HEPN domain-containing protein